MSDLVNETFDREKVALARHATIRAHRRLVGGDGVGAELQIANAVQAARSGCATPCSLPEMLGQPQHVSAGVDIDVALDAEKRTVTLGTQMVRS